MNTLDIILLIFFIPAIIRGISKGLIEQVVGLASLFLSAWLAYLFANKLSTWLSGSIEGVSSEILYIISFIIIIIATVFVLNLAAKLVSKVIETISLGWLNGGLGVLFAIFNTVIILGILFSAFDSFSASTLHLKSDLRDNSILYQGIKNLHSIIFPYIENLFTQISDTGAKMC